MGWSSPSWGTQTDVGPPQVRLTGFTDRAYALEENEEIPEPLDDKIRHQKLLPAQGQVVWTKWSPSCLDSGMSNRKEKDAFPTLTARRILWFQIF